MTHHIPKGTRLQGCQDQQQYQTMDVDPWKSIKVGCNVCTAAHLLGANLHMQRNPRSANGDCQHSRTMTDCALHPEES